MKYDVIIIGSGPGGYVCAIRCAQLGMKTALIEKYDVLGGTCLNVGCIPSKALLDSSEHFLNAREHFEEHGIIQSGLELDMPAMIARKQKVVDQTTGGIDYLMKKNKIDVYHGWGSFVDAHTVQVDSGDEVKKLEGDKIVIATGSKPITPDSMGYDKNRVITSTEALEIKKLPQSMVIIGAGVIGLELGSVFARLGTEVEIIEYQDRILPGMDIDCSKEMRRSLKKLGIKFHLKHAVEKVTGQKTQAKIQVAPRDGGETFELKADYCLIAIGRYAYTQGLGLENVGIETDDRGRIVVDEHLRTKHTHIYAIGDVIKGAMLAHKAEEEGVLVAEFMAGQKPHIDYNLIPGIVYTWPEVASVGKAEHELKDAGIPYKKGKFPYKALGRARASGDTEGMVKVLAHKETDEILGMHIVGARAADMIMEGVALMEFRATAEDAVRMSHPHPTYTEAVREAAMAATADRAIHI